ncbi:hypothetical protein [Tellurirhabdus rosea]|uniref:hypothetical protein n=1 Tax=Tellurirhabdus rosea TaxID=2674997 RepID=UPI00225B4740|nr:hypothetical protein [Tellurirhabdus rosea]
MDELMIFRLISGLCFFAVIQALFLLYLLKKASSRRRGITIWLVLLVGHLGWTSFLIYRFEVYKDYFKKSSPPKVTYSQPAH